MTAEELRQHFVTAGVSCRLTRAEVTIEVCCYCGNERWNLGCSADKGVFYCWACKKGGRLEDLLRLLTGGDYHIPVTKVARATPKALQATTAFQTKPIWEVESAARYLIQRDVSQDVASQYGIVVCVEPTHSLYGRICFPARDFWTSELVGWIGRSYTGKQPKYWSTLTRKVITGWRMRDKHVPTVLVEGPLDGLTVHRAGYQVGILSGTGATDLVQWAARLPIDSPVVIMLDSEAAIQAQQIYWQIHPVRPSGKLVMVNLPVGEDPASLGVERVAVEIQKSLQSGY